MKKLNKFENKLLHIGMGLGIGVGFITVPITNWICLRMILYFNTH